MNTCAPVVGECTPDDAVLSLVLTRTGEPRIDSRLVADLLGVQHRQLIRHVERNQERLESFGQVVFRRQVGARKQGGGNPLRYVLLTENQAYFVATLSQNTEQSVEVKFQIVLAFKKAREEQQAKQGQYLPFLHVAHHAARLLAEKAKAEGSHAPEHVFHSNIERLINKAFGIEAGQREHLTAGQRNQISSAYQIVGVAIGEVLSQGGSQEAAYQEAKRRIGDFAKLFVPVAGLEVQG